MNEQPMTGLQLMGLQPPDAEPVTEETPVTKETPVTEEAGVTEETEFPDHVSRETVYPRVIMPAYSWGADCIGSQAGLLSLKTPVIWPYVTGEGIAWSPEAIKRFREAGARVYLVNQGEPGKPFLGDEFDVEAGAITVGQMIEIIQARRERKWSTRVYGGYEVYREMTEALVALGLRRSVWWRIADWDLSAHLADAELWGDVYAGQWASPTSNPRTMLPFTNLTLEQANADLNVVLLESTGWEG